METLMLVLLGVTALCAAAVGTVAGFGSATVLTPMMLLVVPIESAIVLVALFHGANSAFKISHFWGQWDRDVVLRFGIPSVLLAIPGGLLVGRVPSEWLMILLGLFLLFYGGAGVSEKIRLALAATPLNYWLGGAASGLMAGLVGTGGAIRGFFLHAMGLKKEQYVATGALIALCVDVSRLSAYLAGGAFLKLFEQNALSVHVGWVILVTVAAAFLGVMLAKRWLVRMKPAQFDQWIYWALMIIGIYCVEKSIRHMM